MAKYKFIVTDGDCDWKEEERVIKANLSYRNWKRLHRACRMLSKSYRNYSEYDCTGSVSSEHFSLNVIEGLFIITKRTCYDY